MHRVQVLVTGGSGLIGESLVSELLSRGHGVRLLARRANDHVRGRKNLEPFRGDVADRQTIAGAAEGCDAVVHVAGIATESAGATFESVNVGGTVNVIAECHRAGVARFVHVSSMGADRGQSDYHRSKRAAEMRVRESGLSWTIVRPGGVYGPGDDVVSSILKMVRTLPAVPVIEDGRQEFQPIWHEDLAAVLAIVVERNDLAGWTFEAAGPQRTSMNDLLERLGRLTGREPARVPVPLPLARLAAKIASWFVTLPVDGTKLTMLEEDNTARMANAISLPGVRATPLDEGLRRLADSLPESLPGTGVGRLQHNRFYADIRGARVGAAGLMSLFRDGIGELMPIDFAAEPGAPRRADRGTTLTGSLPLRGNFQVRVEHADSGRVVLSTVEGHPLAGFVEFTAVDRDDGDLRFAVDVWTRAANPFDWLAMATVGKRAQAANWRTVVQRVIDASGGSSEGIREEKETLDHTRAAAAEERIRSMVARRERETPPAGREGDRAESDRR